MKQEGFIQALSFYWRTETGCMGGEVLNAVPRRCRINGKTFQLCGREGSKVGKGRGQGDFWEGLVWETND